MCSVPITSPVTVACLGFPIYKMGVILLLCLIKHREDYHDKELRLTILTPLPEYSHLCTCEYIPMVCRD